MISSNDFRTGITIVVDGNLWTVVDFQHVKPGKGSAFVRTRLKNVLRGNVLEKTFRAGEMLERAIIETRDMQYLYGRRRVPFHGSGELRAVLDDARRSRREHRLLKEGMVITVQFHDGRVIGGALPNHIELLVDETDPGFRGDTANNVKKPAKLETGAEINVPLFINPGDKIRIDTRDRKYIARMQ